LIILGFADIPISKQSQKSTDLSKIIKFFKSKISIEIKRFIKSQEKDNRGFNFERRRGGEFNEGIIENGECNVEINGERNGECNVERNGELKFSSTAKLIQKYNSVWQKSFYDHIIRDGDDLERIREYITNNPLKWELDTLNPINEIK
jgi:REP element-mobilizing transposase RayT